MSGESYSKPPPSRSGVYFISVDFSNWDLLPRNFKRLLAADKSLCKRLGAPIASRTPSKVHGFPILSARCDRPGLSISRKDLRLVEAGMFAAVRFVRMLATRPYPPPPYYAPFTFQQTEAVLEVTRRKHGRNGSKGGRTIRMRCAFPSGNLESLHYKHVSNPGYVKRFAPRPPNVRTTLQAVLYHRAQIRRLSPSGSPSRAWQVQAAATGNYSCLAQRYGLANALWETEVEDNVREAIDIAADLLDIDPTDVCRVRYFQLDLLLECGRFEEAIALLEKYPRETSEARMPPPSAERS